MFNTNGFDYFVLAVTVEDSDDDFAEDEHAAENELIENDEGDL